MKKYSLLLLSLLLLVGCSAPKENNQEPSNVEIVEGEDIPQVVIEDDM